MSRIPRHWLLIAERNAGKSVFASQLSPEYLVCDLDGRWSEQKEVAGQSHVIAESDPLKMVAKMEALRVKLQGKVGTVIYDSGTAVMDLLQSKGRLMEADAREQKQKFNLNDVHRLKADTMRVMRLAALKWHCDVCWIFHVEDSMESGNRKKRTTISTMEMERMKANLNAVLTIVRDEKTQRRGIRIEWSRYNENIAAGQVVWDAEGRWLNVPERLDVFLQNFMGPEGYNGNMYSLPWLHGFLESKGVKFESTEEMAQALEISEPPLWFDRNSWSQYITKALPK
jgi:hypothetical protein